MNTYKLLTPGPLTTTETVKAQMLTDRCTWDREYNDITQKIRAQLLEFANVSSEEYTTILMQGSGTFSVESVMTTAIRKDEKALIITNGAYGERIVKIAEYAKIPFVQYAVAYDTFPDLHEVETILQNDPTISHIVMVHCETTTGILNPLEAVAGLASIYNKVLIVDEMSSFGGVAIDMKALDIAYLVSSANKCIQGVPGFGFVIAKRAHFETCAGNATTLSLDLYDQWKEMNINGKWRYTSPTHIVAAFSQAIDELIAEGGIQARHERYARNNALLRSKLAEVGIHPYITPEKQSPIITTFLFPTQQFNFQQFYQFVKEKGFVIYPGKLTDVDTFRIGNIGEIYTQDIEALCTVIEQYMGVVKQ